MDEVFGEENFVGQFVWKTRQASGKQVSENNTSIEHEYVFCYQRHATTFLGVLRNKSSYKNPDNDSRGVWAKHPLDVGSTKDERPNCFYDLVDPETEQIYHANPNRVWAFSPKSMKKLLKDGKILFHPKAKTRPYLKKFWTELRSEFKPISSWIDQKTFNIKYNTEGTRRVNNLFNGNKIFDYPKPVSLIKIFLLQISKDNDLILDFFAGSGTTADAVMQLNAEDGGNRKYILVQLPEKIDKNKNKTAYDFVKDGLGVENPTIFDITKERLIRAGNKIQVDNKASKIPKDLSKQDFGFKVFETMPIWEDYDFEADEFDKQQTLFNEITLTENDIKALLTTWKTYDGIALTCDLEAIDLGGYCGYYASQKLYLMDQGFKTENLVKLLEKIDKDANFNPTSVVAFGYHFESKNLRENSENLKSYANKKQMDIDFIIRY
jgi:adenine-specific DNA-methyltransferase